MTRPDLDERLRRILKFVVESHVMSADPVGSQHVRVAYHLSISPATIRGAMQRLEEEGLLAHPHTSAGRVPTEAGYRFYVDVLMEPSPLTPATRRAVDAVFERGAGRSEDELHVTASRVLARTSRQLALMAVHSSLERSIDRLHLVPLEDGVVLLALGERGEHGAATTWKPARRVAASSMRRAERWIAERLPLRDAAAFLALSRAALDEAPAEIRSLAAEALGHGARLLDSLRQPAVRIEGAENIASQPEFQSPDRLRGLVSLLAEPAPLTRALDRFLDSESARVAIGRENGEGAMRSCSLIGTGIAVGPMRASLGVLGPVRMPYRRLVGLVSYVGARLAERR